MSRERRRELWLLLLPNLFTAFSIFFGVIAISKLHCRAYLEAFLWVLASGIADGLDGRVARLTGATSKFGAEFDSLADVFAFGVVPALFFFHGIGEHLGRLGVAMTAIFIIFGAIRLARFNISVGSADPNYFIGLPIPAAGILLSGYVVLYHIYSFGNPYTLIGIILLLSFLMVSNIRFPSFKKLQVSRTFVVKGLVLLVLGMVLIYVAPVIGVVTLLTLYTIGGILRAGWILYRYWRLIQRRRRRRLELQQEGEKGGRWRELLQQESSPPKPPPSPGKKEKNFLLRIFGIIRPTTPKPSKSDSKKSKKR
jgi:CDP-diacylglycerol--serine O-phosphatidyltransferase